jgi:hypothetical protein
LAKLTIEVHTKIKGQGVWIETVTGEFSEKNLNF